MDKTRKNTMRKRIGKYIAVLLVAGIMLTIGGSFYMLDYSLSPDAERADTARCFRELFKTCPKTRPWVDSLRRHHALRDTFVTMPTGERHHALFIDRASRKTALILHGWRDCSIDFLYLARIYERELGCNVVLPDLHAHGLSEGEMIQMGWKDRDDALRWLTLFQTDTMVVHGVSMGGATAMMMSAMTFPKGIRDIRFVDDCGYTSVWEEFAGELKNQFGLPEFPLMFSTSLLCKIREGWSFGEASAIKEVSKSTYPMLFIHGSDDTFVPTEMVQRLYDAKPSRKSIWITRGCGHAESYTKYKAEYSKRLREFMGWSQHKKTTGRTIVLPVAVSGCYFVRNMIIMR